ncbi:MAG: wax ester/triacylglycerol synthase family O-acyltransferase, partial [Alphaproteobacteria bacterium]
MQRLSATDASFLYAESEDAPMHVGGITLLDLPENYEGTFYENMLQLAKDRFGEVGLMRWKAVEQPLNLDYPFWVEVAEEDIEWDYHFKLEKLPAPGTSEQLHERVCELHMELLDRNQPLWRVYVFEGLEGGKVAMYNKIHHACMDGQAGVQMSQVMMDLTPEPRAPFTQEQIEALGFASKTTKHEPNLLSAVIDGVADTIKRPMFRQLAPLAKVARESIRQMNGGADEDGEAMTPAPRTIFNAEISQKRSFGAGEMKFAEIKAIRQATGATINDIVVAATGGALRRYLADRGELPNDSLLCMAPVALEQKEGSANNVSSMVMSFGTDIADPVERLAAVSASSKLGKKNFAKLQDVMDEGDGFRLPARLTKPLVGLMGSKTLATRMPPIANATLSNVKGLTIPIYAAGAQVSAMYPVSIVAHANTLNITVNSYLDKIDIGVLACGEIMADPQKLVALMEEEILILKNA